MKNVFKALFAVLLFGSAIVSCSKKDSENLVTTSTSVQDGKPAPVLDKPTISFVSATGASITLQVCAGLSGAPAGFSVQWMLKSEYDALGGWPASSEVVTGSSFCKASFSGVPGASQYNLASNGCAQVTVGDVIYDQVGASSPCESTPLRCGQTYVFRAFAHNEPGGKAKSDWSSTVNASTLPCSTEIGCTFTQGYWKTHGPVPTGNNSYVWPQSVKDNGMQLGTVTYSANQMLAIFNTPAAGNGLINLAHQLMAAKLNVAKGASDASIASSIASADALIGGLVIPPVGGGSLAPAATSALVGALADFNEGKTGPGHCE